jgi:hypothetical protein
LRERDSQSEYLFTIDRRRRLHLDGIASLIETVKAAAGLRDNEAVKPHDNFWRKLVGDEFAVSLWVKPRIPCPYNALLRFHRGTVVPSNSNNPRAIVQTEEGSGTTAPVTKKLSREADDVFEVKFLSAKSRLN